MIYDARMAPYTDIVDNGKSWTYNHLDIVASSTYQSLTPGPTYTFGEAETVDQTEYLPLMCDGKRTGMLMRQEGLRVYVRFEKDKAPYIPGYPAGEDYKDRDLLVYDLGASVGDTYHALTVGEGGAFEWVELRVTEAGTLATASGERDFIKSSPQRCGGPAFRHGCRRSGSLSGVFFTTDLGPEVTGSGYDKKILYDVTGKEGKSSAKGSRLPPAPTWWPRDACGNTTAERAALSFIRSRNSTAGSSPAPLEKEGKTWNRLMRVGSVKWKVQTRHRQSPTTPGRKSLFCVRKTTGYGSSKIRENAYCTTSTSSRVMRLTSRRHTWTSCMNTGLTTSTTSIPRSAHRDSTNFTPCGEASGLAPVTYSSNWGNVGRGDMLHIEFEEEADGAPVRCLRNVYHDPRGKSSTRGPTSRFPHSPE